VIGVVESLTPPVKVAPAHDVSQTLSDVLDSLGRL